MNFATSALQMRIEQQSLEEGRQRYLRRDDNMKV